MKTVFIVNPAAGTGKYLNKLVDNIKKTICDAEIYVTKRIGDAKDFVNEVCRKHGGARFIACGGDGTLSEVLNGAIGCEDAHIGVIPIGSGNDFCRNFEKSFGVENLKELLSAPSVKCDAIKYTTSLNGKEVTGYCANMFNIGFDCNVAYTMTNIKNKSFFKGSFAYFASIFINLAAKRGENLKIELDDVVRHNGKLLLTSIANGKFCGGGIKSNPLAEINDGLININIIKNLSRTRFVTLLPKYMNGTVLEVKNIDRLLLSEKCKKVTVTPLNDTMRISVDGEIIMAGKTTFEIVHNAFNYIYVAKQEVI